MTLSSPQTDLTVSEVAPRAAHEVQLEDRYELRDGEVFLTGLQAIVRIPIEQNRIDKGKGLRTATFISGYPGSPLGALDLELLRQKKLLDAHDVTFVPGLNEELAATAVQGSQLASIMGELTHDGVVGIWYGKTPGLDRATDALRHACCSGASPKGGALVLVGDDVVAKSSAIPSASEMAMAEKGMVVLCPSDMQDIVELGLHGIALSRFSGLWSGLKLATNLLDGGGTVAVRKEQIKPVIPDNTINGIPFVHEVSANYMNKVKSAEIERSLVTARPELARRYARANGLNRIEGDKAARIGFVASGMPYLDLYQALALLGISQSALASSGIRILKLGMVSPLEPQIVLEFAEGLDEIVVVEEKRAFIELAIKDILYSRPGAPAVYGKHGPDGSELVRPNADLPPPVIAAAIAPRILTHCKTASMRAWVEDKQKPARAVIPVQPLANRTPYFCSGCPHNRSTVVPEGSLVGVGIGCSALAVARPIEKVGSNIGLCQMGGEGQMWVGMAPYVQQKHFVQNLGDGTYHHSGSLAVRASIAAGSNITYKLLVNGSVAMTGGQKVIGGKGVPQLVDELIAEGVARIIVTTNDLDRYKGVRLAPGVDLRHRDRLDEAQRELAAIEGVTVLIHDQPCATELRRKRKRKLASEPVERMFINERVCEGCGDCGDKANCLSVQPVPTEFGRKTRIHQASCNKDYSCMLGDCPSFVKITPGTSRSGGKTVSTLAADSLPAPVPKVARDGFNLRITGIGGTGVVTTAQIISTAATMAGMYIRAFDQLGMSQKGGAVVSDIKFSPHPFVGANKVEAGECDLYLGCDLLVAANEINLSAASAQRTIAIVSTAKVPTGAMVTQVGVEYPNLEATLERIRAVSRATESAFTDAREVMLALFDDDQFANIFLVGMAVQAGALPIAAELIEKAIELNGVAKERNAQAFRRGRQFIADPRALQAALPAAARPTQAPSAQVLTISAKVTAAGNPALEALVRHRVGELIAYQNAAYAQRFADAVEQCRVQEAAALGSAGAITLAFARNLYKLMAYKDEYEVARLSVDPAFERQLESEFGPGTRYAFQLHPPILAAMGLKHKISLGSWVKPGLKLLAAARLVRGTWLDPFGRDEVRRIERSLIDEYVQAMRGALQRLDANNAAEVARLAELPDRVRGYGQVKLNNVANFRTQLAGLTQGLSSTATAAGR
ncbi:MAG: indolepyruvate ferredoxin oxidoreductase family protein [Betaproteobacteria bacterium]